MSPLSLFSTPAHYTPFMASANDRDYELFKVLVIGDIGVGKTCILLRYCDDQFEERGMTTLGVDFKSKVIDVGGERIKMQVWDTAGQERFGNVTSSFYRGAHVIIVVYDVSNRESYESVENWLKGIDTFSQGNLSKLVVANKCELAHAVSLEEATAGLSSLGVEVMETSAKEGRGIAEAFHRAAELAVEAMHAADPQPKPTGIIKLDTKRSKGSKKCNC